MGALALAALEGIIGNRADTLFTLIWPSIEAIMIANLLFWCVMFFVLLVNSLIYMYLIQRIQMFKHAFATDHKLLNLDDSLLRGLASWTPSLSTETAMKRIITDLLLDATAEFDGHVNRAALLLPDASGEYLCCWASYQMPQESIDNMKFYVGPDQGRRQKESGVAGEVFISEKLQVGHLRRAANGGAWICEDCHSYIKLSGRRSFPPYLSFVNIPIISTDPADAANSSATTCQGVICFDSMDKDVFDSEASLVVLRTFARRIAVALLIFKLYQNLSLPPPPHSDCDP